MSHSKLLLISGASSGLGLALAERFYTAGYRVVMVARRLRPMQELIDRLGASADTMRAFECDVCEKDAVKAIVDQVESDMGSIDIAVANAGIGYPSAADELDVDLYRQIFDVNVFGALNCFSAVLPQMIARKSGQIVGISSLASYRGLRGAGAYCGSKSALSAIMESFRLDLHDHGVVSTLICPGFIKTPLTDRNLYTMPFLMDLSDGVEVIYNAIVSKRAIRAFPWPLASLVRLGRLMPVGVYDFLMRRRKNEKRLS